jgi:hypothetical protein
MLHLNKKLIIIFFINYKMEEKLDKLIDLVSKFVEIKSERIPGLDDDRDMSVIIEEQKHALELIEKKRKAPPAPQPAAKKHKSDSKLTEYFEHFKSSKESFWLWISKDSPELYQKLISMRQAINHLIWDRVHARYPANEVQEVYKKMTFQPRIYLQPIDLVPKVQVVRAPPPVPVPVPQPRPQLQIPEHHEICYLGDKITVKYKFATDVPVSIRAEDITVKQSTRERKGYNATQERLLCKIIELYNNDIEKSLVDALAKLMKKKYKTMRSKINRMQD